MHLGIVAIMLSSSPVLAAFLNATSSNTTPLTTISSTSITSTGSVVIPGGTTSVAKNGSATVSVAPLPTTFIIPNPTNPPEVQGEYKLRIQSTNGSPHRFDGQYLAAWSTVANATADAVFTKDKTRAARYYLNGTFEQLDLGIPGQLWSMNMNYDLINARWYGVSMRTPRSDGFGTFWLNGTGLQWTPNETPPPHSPGVYTELDSYFGGWFACDWWHGFPQLFYKIGFFNDTVRPSDCIDVILVQEYFK